MKIQRFPRQSLWALAVLLVISTASWADSLPDLTVRSVRLLQNVYQGKCRPVIDAANLGGAIHPYEFSHSDVELLKGDGHGHVSIWGGYGLEVLDPARRLAAPHSSYTLPWNAILLEPGVYYIGARIDSNHKVTESNEANNQFGPVRLVCQGPAMPDLIVRDMRLVQGCKVQVTIANVGKAGLPASAYDHAHGVALQMARNNLPWGGIRLAFVDPGHNLSRPGGTVTFLWFPDTSNLALSPGANSMVLTIDASHVVQESNEGNNALRKVLYCRGPIHGPGHIQRIPVRPNTVLPNDKVKGGPMLQPHGF